MNSQWLPSLTLGILGTLNFRHFFNQFIISPKKVLPQTAQG
jgi:hypothetical protein